MSALYGAAKTLCYTCVAVSILATLIPQKRTRKIMSFVLGLFFISTVVTAVTASTGSNDLSIPDIGQIQLPTYSEEDYRNAVARQTADQLTEALDELLKNEGVTAQDIRLTLHISDEGRISAARVVIYISETDRDQTALIRSVIYRNVAKEPEIVVTGE